MFKNLVGENLKVQKPCWRRFSDEVFLRGFSDKMFRNLVGENFKVQKPCRRRLSDKVFTRGFKIKCSETLLERKLSR